MKLPELQIDCEGMLIIDIMELPISCVVVISEGKAKVSISL